MFDAIEVRSANSRFINLKFIFMSHAHHIPHILKETKKQIDNHKRPDEDKNPIVGAIIGFLFGPIGIGLYFQSWSDFFLCLFVLLLLTFILFGLGAVPGWLFSAGYGYYRALKN